MKNTRKGFTLVELLVVIAILAILATVSVVGYTAFIERAYVSNDQNIASQLNSYLVAMKNDSNGKYYGKDIDEDNVWELTNDILKDGELDSLVPQSLEYGYRFYFDFNTQQYVVLHEEKDVLKTSGAAEIMRAFANEQNTNKPGKFNYGEKGVFIVDTTGSDLADAVRGFYTFDYLVDEEAEKEMSTEQKKAYRWDAYKEILNRIKDNSNYANIVDTANNNIFVTQDGSKVVDDGRTEAYDGHIYHIDENIEFSENTPAIKVEVNEDENGNQSVTPIVVPENVTLIPAGSVNIEFVNSEGAVLSYDDLNLTNDPVDIQISVDELGNIISVEFEYTFTDISGESWEVKVDANKIVSTKPEENDKEVPIKITNYVTDFDLQIGGTEGKVHTSIVENAENVAYVAQDAGSFTLGCEFQDLFDNTKSASSRKINWALGDTYSGVSLVGDEVVFSENMDLESIKVVGTVAYTPEKDENGNPITPKTHEFTIYVCGITTGNIKFGDKVIAEDVVSDVTLIKSGESTTYSIVKNAYTYQNEGVLTLDETITWTYDGTGAPASGTGDFVVTGAGEGTLTIKVGSYLTFKVNVTIADVDNFALQPANSNLTVLGNKSKVLLSDLFTLKGDLPEGSQLVVFAGGSFTGDTYMNPVRTQLQKTEEGTVGLSVDSPAQNITITKAEDLANYELNFTGTDVNTIRIAVMHDGVRISEDVKVKIVDAYNVKTWDQLSANIANNVVFLSDISMPSGNTATLDVSTHTLYGNGHKFDITTGKRGGQAGIITLKTGGVIRDVRIVGAVYSTFAVSVSDDYGTSAVDAAGGSIINSYIANCRSPLRIESGEVFVKDSVLFGGRYANIDMVGGKVTIQGKVATVGQPIKDASGNTVLGTGITVWFNNTEKVVNLDTGAELKQYNFIQDDSAVKKSLPVINFYNVVKISTSDMFSQLFGSNYSAYHYKDSNGTIYVSAGIGSLDKYMDTNKSQDTLKLTGFADGVYSGSVIYSYNIPLYSVIKSKLAEKGINSDPLQMDVRTLQPGNAANAKLFEEYLQLGTYYYPENYTFSNGSVQFKTFPAAE